jgi:hypothetical protein
VFTVGLPPGDPAALDWPSIARLHGLDPETCGDRYPLPEVAGSA